MNPDSNVTITSVTPAGEKFDRFAGLKTIIYTITLIALPVLSIVAVILSILCIIGASEYVDPSQHQQQMDILLTGRVFAGLSAAASLAALVMSVIFIIRKRTPWRWTIAIIIFLASAIILSTEFRFVINMLSSSK